MDDIRILSVTYSVLPFNGWRGLRHSCDYFFPVTIKGEVSTWLTNVLVKCPRRYLYYDDSVDCAFVPQAVEVFVQGYNIGEIAVACGVWITQSIIEH